MRALDIAFSSYQDIPMHAPRLSFLTVLLMTILRSVPHAGAAPGDASTAQAPEELAPLRNAYHATLGPFKDKLITAIKARKDKYVTDLDKLAGDLASTGKIDSVEFIKKERDAYGSGPGTSGFDEEEKKVPPAARELRRNYDRDVAKLRADHATPAKPLAARYAKQLADLEMELARKKNATGALAVRNEKQAIAQVTNSDPLYGGDAEIVGGWHTQRLGWVKVTAEGKVSDAGGASGTWEWQDRGRRKLSLKWNGYRGIWPYTLTPDGGGLIGVDEKRQRTSLDRTSDAK